MQIAYILNTYPQPSQSFIRRELRALEAQGHDITRIAMRRSDEIPVDPQDVSEAAQTRYILAEGLGALALATVKTLATRPAQWFGAFRLALVCARRSEGGMMRHLVYLAEACAVLPLLKDAKVSHVHAHFGTNATTVAMLAHALDGPKYSFTVHGPEEFDSPRALSLGTKISHATFTVAISQFCRSQLCRWADHDDWDRIKVVHCGVEPERFAAPSPMPGGPIRVVNIGRFVEQKGQLALIAAMAKITKEAPDLHLTLIGDGPMRGQIEALISHHRLSDNITLTGWVSEDRVHAELANAHALVMPSFAEGLPMVVMEAMAAARAVITTYIAGSPELVQPGVTGWLVPAGDVPALADALTSLSTTSVARLEEMGQAGRTRALERHDVHDAAAKLAKLMAD